MPDSKTSVFLFSRDVEKLQAHVQGLGVSLGTDTPQGLMWAERFLENSWREDARSFAEERPIFVNTNTEKVVVLLTDGEVVLIDSDQNGEENESRVQKQAAINIFNQRCDSLKQLQNMNLYTIGFDVPGGDFTKALEDCTIGHGQYINAGLNGLDVAFETISAEFNPIRLLR